MTVTTVASRAAAALVAAVAGYASYQHIVSVATGAGEYRSVALVLPLAIDGLILVATLAMLEDKRARRRPRTSARLALLFGVVATLAANVASAEPTVTARLVAAVPAISFLLAVEVLSRSGRRLPADDPAPKALQDALETAPDPKPEPEPINPWLLHAEPIGPQPAPVTPPDRQGDATEPVTRTPRRTPRTLTTAEKVTRAARALPAGTVAQIAARAGVSESTARRHLPPRPVTSPPGPDAAQTPPVPAVNGTDVTDLMEATR